MTLGAHPDPGAGLSAGPDTGGTAVRAPRFLPWCDAVKAVQMIIRWALDARKWRDCFSNGSLPWIRWNAEYLALRSAARAAAIPLTTKAVNDFPGMIPGQRK